MNIKDTLKSSKIKLDKFMIAKVDGGCWCFKRAGYRIIQNDDIPEAPSTFKISSVNKYFFVESIGRNVDFAEGRKGRVKIKGGVVV